MAHRQVNENQNVASKGLIVDYIPFEVTPEQINESIKTNNGKLIVKGVLQRADAKNQNGRVYPREVLVKEAKKYAEIQIKRNTKMVKRFRRKQMA